MKVAPRTTLSALVSLPFLARFLALPLALSAACHPGVAVEAEDEVQDTDPTNDPTSDPANDPTSSASPDEATPATTHLCYTPIDGGRLCWDVLEAPISATAAVPGVFDGEPRALIADADLGLSWLRITDDAIDLQSIAEESLHWRAESGVVGDGDGDGLPEIALHTGDHAYWLDVLAGGACDGAVYSPGAPIVAITAGDVDGDGLDNPIFVYQDANGDAAASILIDDLAVVIALDGVPASGLIATIRAITAADVDGDGQDELVVATPEGVVVLEVALTNGITVLTEAIDGLGGDTIVDLVAVDLDVDGVDEVIVHQRPATCATDECGDVIQILGSERQSYRIGAAAGPPQIADLDGDGAPDLAVTHASTGAITVLLGDGAGSFRDRFSLGLTPGAARSHLRAADLDGDGRGDLMVYGAGPGATAPLRVLRSRG